MLKQLIQREDICDTLLSHGLSISLFCSVYFASVEFDDKETNILLSLTYCLLPDFFSHSTSVAVLVRYYR